MLFYLQSHSVYYFCQARPNLIILEASIPAVPVGKQKNFQENYSVCAATTATFD